MISIIIIDELPDICNDRMTSQLARGLHYNEFIVLVGGSGQLLQVCLACIFYQHKYPHISSLNLPLPHLQFTTILKLSYARLNIKAAGSVPLIASSYILALNMTI